MLNSFLKIRYKEYSTGNSQERFRGMLKLINGFRASMIIPTYALAFVVNIFWITSTLLTISAIMTYFLLKKKGDSKFVINMLGVVGVGVDFVLATTVLFLVDTERFEYGMNLFLLAIVIEAAYLWKMRGAIYASFVASFVTSYWLFYRDDFQYTSETITAVILRFALFMIISLGVGVLVQVFQDTTDELAAHYEMQTQTVAQLKQVADLKDDFISVASHELRTPITSLFGYMNVVDDPRLGDEKREEVKEGMDRQVKRLHTLVEDLLAVGLIDSDRSGAVSETSDLKTFINELVFDLQESNNGRKVEIVFDKETTRTKNYQFDVNFLRRILNNLIQNSFKYSEDGTPVTLSVSSTEDRLSFDVKDEGFGIEESELESIFNKFHRAKENRNIAGTGLGLYIVKGLVEAMGGEITVQSEVGVGTTMSFYIAI